MVSSMIVERQNNVFYFFMKKNDLFFDKNSSNKCNDYFSTYTLFWSAYVNAKQALLNLKKNPSYNISDRGIEQVDLEKKFIENNIPEKYQKFIIAIPKCIDNDGYELETRTEFDLTSLNKFCVDDHIFAFGKSYENYKLYTCFELKKISEEEVINFRKELKENNILENYQKVANDVFKTKPMVRKK